MAGLAGIRTPSEGKGQCNLSPLFGDIFRPHIARVSQLIFLFSVLMVLVVYMMQKCRTFAIANQLKSDRLKLEAYFTE